MAALLFSLATPAVSQAQLLLRDDFNGTGNVDTTVWRLPFGSEGTFVGRTQFGGDAATDVPQQVAEPLASDGSVMEINLDTYSPIDPGNQFLGTDVLTKRNFARGGGLTLEARMRLKPGVDGGLVNGFFLFDVGRDTPPGSGTLVRDEIDWELLSNQTVGAATQDPATNYWNEGPFAGPSSGGDLQFHDVAGLDLTQFQNYKIEWTPQSLKWFINDQLVRTETSNIPDDPQKLHFNLWAAADDFGEAYNAGLMPVALEGDNTTYTAQVDWVEVNRINTTVSDNLLTDGGFELFPTDINTVPATTTDEWLAFNNVFFGLTGGTNQPTAPVEGFQAAVMFGPFNGNPDASGVLQNVPAEPGQEFEASVFSQTVTGDSIAGNENFTTIALSFLDASGNVIQEAFGDPSNLVETNGKDFPLLDGRDPNLVTDEWVPGTVNAIAPEGTAYARVSLFFIQLNNEAGAAWFDDAQLRLLTPDTPALVDGDFNGDGRVDNGDLNLLLGSWGSATVPPEWVNGFSSPVDNGELNALLGDWGFGISVAVPEPSTACLGLFTLAGLAVRRR